LSDGIANFQVKIPKELAVKFKSIVTLNYKNQRTVIIELIENYVKEYEADQEWARNDKNFKESE